MIKKVCINCGRESFSSGDWGKWYCPYCGEDLSEEKARSLNEPKKQNQHYNKMKGKYYDEN